MGELNAAALLFQDTLHQRNVDLLDGALVEGFRKPGVRKIIFATRRMPEVSCPGDGRCRAAEDRRTAKGIARGRATPLTSVPWEFPAPACTIMPAALLMAMTSSSS